MLTESQAVNREKIVPREIEIKLRLDDPEALRRLLPQIGAVPMGRRQELNRLLDTRDRSLTAVKCGLRVRSTHPDVPGNAPGQTTLTFKGPRAPGTGPLKDREEIQTRVDDPDALLNVLARLGYRDFMVFEKRRERWRLKNTLIGIDELPRLGWFVEIEGPSTDAVYAVQRLLHLPEASGEPRTYAELVAEIVQPDANGVRQLTFDR